LVNSISTLSKMMCLFSVQLSSPSTLPNLLAYKLTLAVDARS